MVTAMAELKPCRENCAECKHHDIFWGGAGCNLLNSMERCKFEPKEARRAGEEEQDG